MWVAKVRLISPKIGVGYFAFKHHVTLSGYPLRYWKSKGKYSYALVVGNISGSEINKKSFFKDALQQGLFTELELNRDFFIGIMRTLQTNDPIYDPQIIWLKPAYISSEGYQIWEMASWEKEVIQKVVAVSREFQGKLLKLTQEKVGNVSLVGLKPELTAKQQRAYELASENGYYEYPRKTELKVLAKKMGVSYATYQAHLRKAERALLSRGLK